MPSGFAAALNDDLSVPAALAVLFGHVSQGQQELAARNAEAAARIADEVRAMLDVLGCNPDASNWLNTSVSDTRATTALHALVSEQLAARERARVEKNWALSDEIRDSLVAIGIDIEDTPDGARWSLSEKAGN